MKKPLTTKLKKLAGANEAQEELYGLEALEKTGLASLQSVLATQLEEQGSIQVIDNILNQDLGSDYLDQVSFIKNTTDLSDTNTVLNELINASETLLDDIQIGQLVESLGASEFEEEPMDSGFGDEEYEEPEDWSTIDEEQPAESSEENPEGEDEGSNGEAHEALEATGSIVEKLKALGSATEETTNKSLDEEAAYYWFDKTFYDWLETKGDKELDDNDWNEFKAMLDSAPYDRDLLQWIWDECAELDDGGYEYEIFVTICGHYPGNYTNWQQTERPAEETIPSTGKSLVERLKALGSAAESAILPGEKTLTRYVLTTESGDVEIADFDFNIVKTKAEAIDPSDKPEIEIQYFTDNKGELGEFIEGRKIWPEESSTESLEDDLGGYDRLVDSAFVEGSDE